MKCLLALLLIASPAFATGLPHTPTGTHSESSAEAKSFSASNSKSTSSATQTATGGEQSQSNDLSVNYPRLAPSTAQGSLAVGNCGSGGNAGGSNTHGSAFLGFAWTPKDCKLLLAASAYQALGMYDAACEMVNGIKAVRKQWTELGLSPPSCAVKPPEPVVPQPVTVNVEAAKPDLAGYATHEEVNEKVNRALGAGK